MPYYEVFTIRRGNERGVAWKMICATDEKAAKYAYLKKRGYDVSDQHPLREAGVSYEFHHTGCNELTFEQICKYRLEEKSKCQS